MNNVLFKIGSIDFYTHGIIAVLGIALGMILAYRLAKKAGLDTALFYDRMIITILIGLVGARLTYFFLYREQFQGLGELFNLTDGGMVSYGGFILGGLVYWLLLRFQKENIAAWFDLTSIGFFLGLAVGRLGDFATGEYNGIFKVYRYPIVGELSAMPVSLMESLLCIVIFVISLRIFIKDNNLISGTIAISSIAIYSLIRFLIDFWRPEKDILLGVSPGQITSLVIFVLSAFFLFIIFKKNRSRYGN